MNKQLSNFELVKPRLRSDANNLWNQAVVAYFRSYKTFFSLHASLGYEDWKTGLSQINIFKKSSIQNGIININLPHLPTTSEY